MLKHPRLSSAAAVARWLTGYAGFDGGFLTRTLLPWLIRRPGRWGPAIRLFRNLAAAEARRLEQQLRHGTELPTTLVLSPTSACNLRCPSCLVLDELDRPGAEIDGETLRRVLDECRDLGIAQVVIVGGEPLLHRGLDDLLVENRDLYFTVFTNGRALRSSRAETYAALANVTFVVNAGSGNEGLATGLDPDVERAMELLRDRDLLFGVSTTITSANVEIFASLETLERIRELGARFALFFAYLPDLLDPGHRSSLLVSDRVRRVFVECVRAWGAARGLYTVFAPEDEDLLMGGCGAAGRRIVHVGADGSIGPCPFVPSSRFHISRNSLLEAIRSDAFRALRRRSGMWGQRAAGCAYRAFGDEFRELTAHHNPLRDSHTV